MQKYRLKSLHQNIRERILLFERLGFMRGVGRCPADADISEAVIAHMVRIEEVAAVDDDGVAQTLIEPDEIELLEFGPVREDHHGICVFSGSIGIVSVAKVRTRRKLLLAALHRGRIEDGDRTTFGEEHLNNINGG